MKKKITMVMSLVILILSTVPVHAVEYENDRINLEKSQFSEDWNPQFFVAYVYYEDNPENPFNNPGRDITIHLDGDWDYYYTSEHYNYINSPTYQSDGVVRITGKIPLNTDWSYYLHMETSDASDGRIFFKTMYFDREVTARDELHIQEGYNEFYFVGGSETWVKEHGSDRLKEMYERYHSDSADINDNQAGNEEKDRQVLDSVAREMREHPEISEIELPDGTVCTRDELIAMGYDLSPEGEGAEEDASGSGTDEKSPGASADSGAETDAGTAESSETREIPSLEKGKRFRLTGLGQGCAIGAGAVVLILVLLTLLKKKM